MNIIKDAFRDEDKRSKTIMLICFIFAAFLPLLITKYKVLLLCKTLLLSLCAMAYILLSGFGGMPSFANISFYGITAYTIAVGVALQKQDFVVMAILGILLTLAISMIYAFISVRAIGRYFFQISIAFVQLVYLTVVQAADLTRGIAGISGIPVPNFLGLNLSDRNTIFFLTLIVVALCYFMLKRIVSSPFGIALKGVRDNPRKISAMGFNVKLHRFQAIILSAFFSSIAGLLWVVIYRVIAPENISMNWAIMIVLIAMLGCAKKLEGAFLGAIIYVFAEDRLTSITQRHRLFIGIFFVLLVLFLPNGLMGTKFKTYFRDLKIRFNIQTRRAKKKTEIKLNRD